MRNKIKMTAIVCFWLLLWQLLSMIIKNQIFFASPISVAAELAQLCVQKEFWITVFYSLMRILLGFFVAFLLAFLLSLLSHRYALVQDVMKPFLTVIQSVPVASVVVLLLIWFGSETLSVYVTFMVVFPIIYTNMLTGLKGVPTEMKEMAYIFRFSARERYHYLYRPAFLPHLYSGVETAVGMSFKSGVAAEIIGQPAFSIGEQIYSDKIFLNTAGVFAWTIVVVILSALVGKVLLALMKVLFRNPKKMKINGKSKRRNYAEENETEPSDIICRNVAKHFEDGTGLDVFSYCFKKGERYCIMGESGIGKTTLLKIVAGLTEAECGTINRIKTVSMVFQENRLCDTFTALQNAAMAADCYEHDEIAELLQETLQEDCGDKRIEELSGGMQRRVALLRALLADSKLLLLDEPFTGLDEENRKRMAALILRMQKGRTILFTSHDGEDAKNLKAELICLSGKERG